MEGKECWEGLSGERTVEPGMRNTRDLSIPHATRSLLLSLQPPSVTPVLYFLPEARGLRAPAGHQQCSRVPSKQQAGAAAALTPEEVPQVEDEGETEETQWSKERA